MSIKSEILKEHSKNNTERVADLIGNNKNLLSELVNIVLNEDNEVARKAAWVMRSCYEKCPGCMDIYLPKLIQHLNKGPLHDAIKRNILGILISANIPQKKWGFLIDLCFKFLISGQESISVKAFSMEIIQRYAKSEPLIYNELSIIIEDQLPFGSAGFKSKASKILREKNRSKNL